MSLGEGRATMLNRGKGVFMLGWPAGDIANMEDVMEVMTPNEIIDWKIKRIMNLVSRTPVLQNLLV